MPDSTPNSKPTKLPSATRSRTASRDMGETRKSRSRLRRKVQTTATSRQATTQRSSASQPSNPSLGSDPELSDELVAQFLELVCQEKETNDASMPSWEDPVSVFFSVTKPEIETDVYVKRLVRYAQCSRAAFIIGLVYLRRLEATNPKLGITPYNMHRLLITSLMIAAKMLDDRCYSNAHYARVGGIATVKEVNRLELQMLALLRYNIFVSPEEYNHFVGNLKEGFVPSLSAKIARVHEAFPREARRSCAMGIPPLVSEPKSRPRPRPRNRMSTGSLNNRMDIDTPNLYRFEAPFEDLRVCAVANIDCAQRKEKVLVN